MTKFTTDYVFNTATNTNGMTKNEIVCFHLYNPNGLVAKLPDFDDFIHGDVFFAGCEILMVAIATITQSGCVMFV